MEREEFRKKAEKSLNLIFDKIDELEAKKAKAKESVKAEYEEKLALLRSQKANLQEKYDKLKDASDEKWQEVKEGFGNAAEVINKGVSDLLSRFK